MPGDATVFSAGTRGKALVIVSDVAAVVVADLARPVRASEQPALQFRFSEPLPSDHYTDPLFEVVDVLQWICLQQQEIGAHAQADSPELLLLPEEHRRV